MHLLRFLNSGIIAKVFVRKIGFKLRVMRLNRVESFNTFAVRTTRRRGWPWLAARGSRLRPRPPTRGRLAKANPPCRGGRLQPRPPCKGAAGHLQGAAAPASPQGATASRGGGADRRGGRPLAGRLPTATCSAVAYAGAAATVVQEGEEEG
ncbi:hypothetical protein BHM03_00046611 [Ensete ventricosum]|nr:hypothetical protein BHM03_00046611 [Ensete ventricosum]